MSLIQTHLAWRGLIVDQSSHVTRLPLELPTAKEESLQIAIHAQLGYFALRLDQMLTGFAHRIGAASGMSSDAIAVLAIVPGHEDRNADLSPRTLADLALSFMGEGRYKNHRGMRTAPHNKATQHGALSVLELLHGPIMGLAQEIRKQMFDDGFLYIPAPSEREAYAALRATMAPGRVIEPAVLVEMQAIAFSPQILPQLDVHLEHTFLPDKIAVAVDKGVPAPMGFIVDRQGGVLDHELVRGIMIMELLRRGGFHGLSEEEQMVLQNEHFRFTEASRLNQAMALNGVLSVLNELADHHGLQISDGEAKIVRLHCQLHDPRLGDIAQDLLMCDAVRRIVGCLQVLREDERAAMGLTPPLR